MNILPIKTEIITPLKQTIINVIDESVKDVAEQSVLAVSSKIISLCEGSACDPASKEKDDAIRESAQLFLDRVVSKYNSMITITNNTLMLAAGIDESNSDGMLVLWPKNPLQTAQEITEHIKKKYALKDFGVVVVDSTSRPLRIGSIGTSLAHTGFLELNDYIGTKDLFGKTMLVSQANVAECIATAAVLAMGEGSEQTPMALISDIPNITFDANAFGTCYQKSPNFIDDDIYAPILKSVEWRTK